MATTVSAPKFATKAIRPRVLVVDDEPDLLTLVRDVVGNRVDCKILAAKSVAEARQILAREPVELLVTDLNLPDGDGMSLMPALRQHQPTAESIIITGRPSVGAAIDAIRAGAVDFLPKPFSADQLVARVNLALDRQRKSAKTEKRLDRLRDAVRRLNVSRRTVTKKVDLLCNDLVTAYGELSKQLDDVRHQEAFRKLLMSANDLEQMLCHAMDWILREMGYCNVAIWLADEDEFQLGAYMKYTIAGEPPFTESMRNGILPLAVRNGCVHMTAEEAANKLTPKELEFMDGQTVLAVNCTYLGESLAAMVLFRDDKSPFTEDDVETLKGVSPVFATMLASIVKRGEDPDAAPDDYENGGLLDEDDDSQKKRRKAKDKTSDADWWKRGEDPPF